MNSRTILLAAPLLVLVAAIGIRQTLRKRNSGALAPEVVASRGSSQNSVTSSQVGQAPAPARNPGQSDPAPVDAAPVIPESESKAVASSNDPQLRALAEAIETSYESTIAAFALHDVEADYEAHDARAERDAGRLQQLFASMRSDLAGEVVSCCEVVIDRIAAAQLQLMAFAINRKNRGLPDSAQIEAERADRKAFKEELAPLFERVKAALGARGISLSTVS